MRLKTYDELLFSDDFLFCLVMQDERLCRRVIEVLLHVKVGRIEYLNKQQELSPDFDARGVRLDVYVKDSDRVFDLEMQATASKNLPQRARYYQSLIDIDSLGKRCGYDTLKESYVVFICTEDPFGGGLPCYTARRVCEEDSKFNKAVNDKTTMVYYNASAWQAAEDAEIRAFLKFISTQSADTDLTSELNAAVRNCKRNENWRKNFMTLYEKMEEYKAFGFSEGREAGARQKAVETARNFLKMGFSMEQVASGTGLPLAEVQKLAANSGGF